jgi:4-carboxymuconolactone decarboxylase
MNTQTRFEKGAALLAALNPQALGDLERNAGVLAPDLVKTMVEFAYGDVLSKPGLDLKSRQIATVAALAGLGNAPAQLAFHLGASLNIGLSPEDMVEVMYLVAVFAGFPAALNGLFTAREVFAARDLTLKAVKSPAASTEERRGRGLKALGATSGKAGVEVIESLRNVAPDMPEFLLEFSYGDVIARPGLSPKHKEIVMIAVSAARGTMRPQLKVHLKAGLAVGLTKEEMIEILVQMAVYAGFPAALNALGAAREAFAEAS